MSVPGFTFGVMLGAYSWRHLGGWGSVVVLAVLSLLVFGIILQHSDVFLSSFLVSKGSWKSWGEHPVLPAFVSNLESSHTTTSMSNFLHVAPTHLPHAIHERLMQCDDMFLPGTEFCGEGKGKGGTTFCIPSTHWMFDGFIIVFKSSSQLHQFSYKGMCLRRTKRN